MEQTGGLRPHSKVRLWSNNMWMICLSHLLLSTSLYMLIPALPVWLVMEYASSAWEIGGILALSGVSIFFLGPFFNYLVDRLLARKYVCGPCLWLHYVLLAFIGHRL